MRKKPKPAHSEQTAVILQVFAAVLYEEAMMLLDRCLTNPTPDAMVDARWAQGAAERWSAAALEELRCVIYERK